MIPPSSSLRRGPSRWHFDVDKYLNPFVPPSALPRLPAAVAHFLGHRTHAPAHPLGNLAMVFWAVVGIFSSLAVIGAVAQSVPEFQARGVPVIIGSFGAAAVLDFYAIESPLAQPRNAVLGQLVSAATGVALCKLFALSPGGFEPVRWLAASLACACATALMALTGTVHPPAGATALMAVLDRDVARLGWFLLAPLLLGCCLMLAVALLVNNVQRRFPFYWWTPGETGTYWRRWTGGQAGHGAEKEKSIGERTSSGSSAASSSTLGPTRTREEEDGDEDGSGSSREADLERGGELARTVSVEQHGRQGEIVIRRGRVVIPAGLSLRPEEILSLETLSERL